jgi:hypothetical protein
MKGRGEKCVQYFIRKPSGTNHSEDKSAGGRAKLELILKKKNGIFIE